MTATSLLLAAVISLALLTGCQPDPPAAGSAIARLPVAPAPGDRFELAVEAADDDPTRITVVVTSTADAFAGIDEETAQGLIEVRAETPVLGSVTRVSNRELRFSPSFPLLTGSDLLVRFDPTGIKGIHAKPIEHRHRVPSRPTAPAPTIINIYPTSPVLPANHLKFYFVFSEPMQPGEIWNHFHLVDIDNNRPVPRPFRHTALWSPDNKTLTLWFHPGRVKQGVNLNTDIGPILVKGRRYRLGVSGDWLSARGTPLGNDVTREFTAGSPDYSQPNLADWDIVAPDADSRTPLVCRLGSPHDWALLHSDVTIETATGEPVDGSFATLDHQSAWQFTPRSAWKAGQYRLAIGSVLEDLAGNSLERPFEVDISKKSDSKKQPARTFYRKFTIGP